jgi:hypothetical protein
MRRKPLGVKALTIFRAFSAFTGTQCLRNSGGTTLRDPKQLSGRQPDID